MVCSNLWPNALVTSPKHFSFLRFTMTKLKICDLYYIFSIHPSQHHSSSKNDMWNHITVVRCLFSGLLLWQHMCGLWFSTVAAYAMIICGNCGLLRCQIPMQLRILLWLVMMAELWFATLAAYVGFVVCHCSSICGFCYCDSLCKINLWFATTAVHVL